MDERLHERIGQEIKRKITLSKKPPKKRKTIPGVGAHNPKGRPELYTDGIAAHICRELMLGKTLTKICEDSRVPSMPTVFNWLNPKHGNFRPDFLEVYRTAREIQAEVLADQMMDIADDTSGDVIIKFDPKTKKREILTNHDNINRSRLKIETRKWEAAHMQPKKFSDRVQFTGKDDEPLMPQTVKLVVNFISPDEKVEKKK